MISEAERGNEGQQGLYINVDQMENKGMDEASQEECLPLTLKRKVPSTWCQQSKSTLTSPKCQPPLRVSMMSTTS